MSELAWIAVAIAPPHLVFRISASLAQLQPDSKLLGWLTRKRHLLGFLVALLASIVLANDAGHAVFQELTFPDTDLAGVHAVLAGQSAAARFLAFGGFQSHSELEVCPLSLPFLGHCLSLHVPE